MVFFMVVYGNAGNSLFLAHIKRRFQGHNYISRKAKIKMHCYVAFIMKGQSYLARLSTR